MHARSAMGLCREVRYGLFHKYVVLDADHAGLVLPRGAVLRCTLRSDKVLCSVLVGDVCRKLRAVS